MMLYIDQTEWNEPDRTDHYLMSIDSRVASLFSKFPSKIEQHKLVFQFGSSSDESSKANERAKRVAFSKGAWAAAAGGTNSMTIVDRDGNVLRPPTVPVRSTPFRGKGATNRPPSSRPVSAQPLPPQPLPQRVVRDNAEHVRTRNPGHPLRRGHQGPEAPAQGG